MYFTLHGRQQDFGRDLRAFVHRRVAFAFDRFDQEVLSVMAYLNDRQPGDDDSVFHCNLVVVTVDGAVHEVTADAVDAEPAIGMAIDRMVERIGAWKKDWSARRRATLIEDR